MRNRSRILKGIALALGMSLVVGTVSASHSWNNYHWARNTSSFNLQVIDSTTPNWDVELGHAVNEWSQSNSLNLNVTAADDSSKTRRRCPAVSGKIRVCNMAYGSNGWLGLASINLDSQGHISQGTAKMNDSYFMDANERRHVMCQEVGHTFGLGHTSEDGSSQSTCMDYSSSPHSISPNSHDYQQLTSIYSHTDSYNSYSTSTALSAKGVSNAMVGDVPMGVRVRTGHFSETWAAPDGKGGMWIHHVYLAPGFEHVHAE